MARHAAGCRENQTGTKIVVQLINVFGNLSFYLLSDMIGLRAFYRCRLIQQRHDLTKRPASSSIISPAKVSKCVVISCVSLWASLAHPMRRFISVAERSKQFSSSRSLTSWSPLAAIRKIEVSIVSALLIDDAIACLESSAASFFWNWSLSECQRSFWHFLNKLYRETPNFGTSHQLMEISLLQNRSESLVLTLFWDWSVYSLWPHLRV